MKKVDVLVAEIGSTTTVVNAFYDFGSKQPKLLGQGIAATTVLDGDVTIGLENAVKDLEKKIKSTLKWDKIMASSSAAGGLKMTVHGLVYDMTAKAAKEAALGAGAVLHFVTAGILSDEDINQILKIMPNIILLAGGVDYGEKNTVLTNAKKISALGLKIPIVYAGNMAVQNEVREIFKGKNHVYFTENVYPRIDELNIEPTRCVIQKVFEQHIVEAPGMDKIRNIVNGPIVPTPGAVMNATKLLRNDIGDLMVLDVGGATTDVHSVAEDSEEVSKILIAPEPESKRTVEGDLGVFVNRHHVLDLVGHEKATETLGFDTKEFIETQPPIPQNAKEIKMAEYLAQLACKTAVGRHAGEIKYLFGPGGRFSIANGKDLTQIKWIIGTGGALTKLPNGIKILKSLRQEKKGQKLLPTKNAEILIDNYYIMASLGVLSVEYPSESLSLLKQSLKFHQYKCMTS
jgi:uncharacterized protein (TIGR01319 family)